MTQLIRVMCGGLSNRVYAVRRYSNRPNGLIVAAAGGKDDVTAEAVGAVIEHVMSDSGCSAEGCPCGYLTVDRERVEHDLERVHGDHDGN